MLTKENAHALAHHWIEAWNSHDLDRIIEHYADDVVLVSPVAARLLGVPDGAVHGKAALRAYFRKGLAVYPELRFELTDVMWGINSIVLCYTNQINTKSAEFMEIDSAAKIIKVIANYGAA